MLGPVSGRFRPTAVQAVAWHATPLKKLPWPADSTGVGWMAQVVPFQRSTRVVVPEFDVAFRFPAAVQPAGVVHDTAARTPPGGGLGVGWMVQFVPFHRSASVPMGLPALSVWAPTAVQNEGEVQDTPARKLPAAPVGVGTGRICHRVPSHRSATSPVGKPELSKDVPTAMQNVLAVQETPNRAVPGAPAGLGVGWMVQFVPFHCSARVAVGLPKLSVRAPTAVHAMADVHDTAAREPPPAGFGVCWMRQVVPSHRSASGPFADVPVAVQAEAAVQDTPARTLDAAPVGLGVGWMVHWVPFHCSARARKVPELLMEYPAAAQAEEAGQATPSRKFGPPARLGVGWMVQFVPSHRSARVWDVPELVL
jgi:hypothetical protein